MPIIYKCDVCEKEFQPERNMMTGEAMFSVYNHYYKANIMSKENPIPQKQIKVNPRMFCLECSEKVDKKVEELKNE